MPTALIIHPIHPDLATATVAASTPAPNPNFITIPVSISRKMRITTSGTYRPVAVASWWIAVKKPKMFGRW